MNRQANNKIKATSIKVQFLAGVELGVLSSKCKNFGVCRVFPMGRIAQDNPKAFKTPKKGCNGKCRIEGVVSVLEGDRVEICFLRASISESIFKKHFKSGKFLVEEEFVFSVDQMPSSNFKIRKGIYPIVINETLLTILFTY